MSENIKINGVTYNEIDTVRFVRPDGSIASFYSEGGTTEIEEKDVNFYDYDGTLLYSYTIAEAQALTELPALPVRSGLTCQGWNWELDDVKALTRPMTIGAMYITDDGVTRLYIHLDEPITVPLNLTQTVANGVTIDWGDGSATETYASTGEFNLTHQYESNGEYIICIHRNSGNFRLGAGTRSVFGADTINSRKAREALIKAEIGLGFTVFSSHCFSYCTNLETVTTPNILYLEAFCYIGCAKLKFFVFPKQLTGGGNYAFSRCPSLTDVAFNSNFGGTMAGTFGWCSSLKRVNLPDGVAVLNDGTFTYCNNLKTINVANPPKFSTSQSLDNAISLQEYVVGSGTTTLPYRAFAECYSLRKIVFTSDITSIAANAFVKCYSMTEYDFTMLTSVPSLANTNAFTNAATDFVIKVPADLYDGWISATNWTAYVDHIVAV